MAGETTNTLPRLRNQPTAQVGRACANVATGAATSADLSYNSIDPADVPVTNIGDDAPAATDTITIKKAHYRTSTLHIRAQSTDAAAVLSACADLDTVCSASSPSFLGVLVDGNLRIDISPAPSAVRVDSDKGAFDTKAVEVK